MKSTIDLHTTGYIANSYSAHIVDRIFMKDKGDKRGKNC